MRILLPLMLGCSLAVAATHQEAVTYVDGDLSGVALNSGGSLVFSDESAMELKTGLAAVAVPYKEISKVELGAIRKHSSDEPLYKVWAIHKKMFKPETQLLKVEFTNQEGERKSMTVEMAKAAAPGVMEFIHQRSPLGQKEASTGWWGDRYWRTNRNTAQWAK